MLIFNGGATFVTSVYDVQNLPAMRPFEFAFLGRSNVGKSSLINALCRQKGLAKTSNTPGRTQSINFFSVKENVFFIDLPGYGFAKAPTKLRESWQLLTEQFLKGRPLTRLFVLIDIRHGFHKNDKNLFSTLDTYAQSYQVIFTKADKVASIDSAYKAFDDIKDKYMALYPSPLITSSKNGLGISSIQNYISEICNT